MHVFAGREIFVGLSQRTNMQGAQAVAKAFPEYSTTIVKVPLPAVHLKDCITMAGIEVFAIAKSEAAQKIFQVRFGQDAQEIVLSVFLCMDIACRLVFEDVFITVDY